jgi:hypothetical protein
MAAALEFGAMQAIDFGPAHGRLYVLGGLYYEMEVKSLGATSYRAVKYRAYVRAGGEVEALGLISLSIDIYVGLEAKESASASYLIGTATATFNFEVALVKKSFSVTYTQRFQGSDKPAQVMTTASTFGELSAVGLADAQPRLPVPDDDPPGLSFETMMPREQWAEYWTAFA